MELRTLLKILNSGATRMSYPNELTPYEMTPSRCWELSKGSIMPSLACSMIQRSFLIDIRNKM